MAKQDISKESLEQGHETRDASFKWAVLTALGFVLLALVIHLAVWRLFDLFKWQADLTGGASLPTAAQPQLPAEPRLEADGAAFRLHYQAEQAQLDTYGWIYQAQGVVRIPVSRAITLLAQRGLPYKQGGPHAP
jgi:hypothetical protein